LYFDIEYLTNPVTSADKGADWEDEANILLNIKISMG
jgi:hypothetical protein